MTPLELIRAIRDTKARAGSQAESLAVLSQALVAFVSEPANQHVNFATTTTGLYTRILLNAFEDDFQIVVVLWGPHSRSPIHDHSGTVGAVAALVGSTKETKYQVMHTKSGTAYLKKLKTTSLSGNQVTPILPDEATQLHDMVNDTDEWAATVHTYLTPVNQFYIYEPQQDGSFEMITKDLWFDVDNAWKSWYSPAVPASEVVPQPQDLAYEYGQSLNV
ncbi:MAG TPA: cysteine dioxygenase family protein [Herpetosiphonaceae bacterium]